MEGVEIDGSLVSHHNPYRERIYIGPFDRSFQPSKQFTLIVLLDVLEHLQDPRKAIEYALGNR